MATRARRRRAAAAPGAAGAASAVARSSRPGSATTTEARSRAAPTSAVKPAPSTGVMETGPPGTTGAWGASEAASTQPLPSMTASAAPGAPTAPVRRPARWRASPKLPGAAAVTTQRRRDAVADARWPPGACTTATSPGSARPDSRTSSAPPREAASGRAEPARAGAPAPSVAYASARWLPASPAPAPVPATTEPAAPCDTNRSSAGVCRAVTSSQPSPGMPKIRTRAGWDPIDSAGGASQTDRPARAATAMAPTPSPVPSRDHLPPRRPAKARTTAPPCLPRCANPPTPRPVGRCARGSSFSYRPSSRFSPSWTLRSAQMPSFLHFTPVCHRMAANWCCST